MNYWRTAQGAEVDYVLNTPTGVIPIEVKASTRPDESDIRHLKLFLRSYPEKSQQGFLVCRCAEPRRLHEQITAIPFSMM